MITMLELGTLFTPLEKMFKQLNKDQISVYYEKLKGYDGEIMKRAVDFLLDEAKKFPSPGEIKRAYRDMSAQGSSRSTGSELPSCHRCQHGYVQFWYEQTCRNGKTIRRVDSKPCGFCNTEPNASQHHIQVDNQIYKAARLLPGTKYMWVPDTNNREIRMDILEPVYAQKDLEIYCEQERSGKFVRSEPPKEFLEKIRGITGKTPSLSFDPEEAL